jgi:hypothetical protein
MVAKIRNDQVFQLSLTEIAFSLVFILLLLLGYLVHLEQARREVAEIALANTRGAEASAAAMQTARSELAQALAAAGTRPENLDSIIMKISAAKDIRDERDRLKKQIDDLDAQLSAMNELQKVIEASASKKDVALAEVVSALKLQDQVRKALVKQLENSNSMDDVKNTSAITAQLPPQSPEERAAMSKEMIQQVKEAMKTADLLKSALKKQLDQTLKPGQEAKTIEDVVAAARMQLETVKGSDSIEAAKKENSDLRGQVAFFKRRLEARGGRDYPPCWATESGAPEYLFMVDLTPTGVNVKPSWPSNREADAKALPDINAALQTQVGLDAFVVNIQGIFNASRKADPQCRHYVYLKSTIADAVSSDRARLTVEKYFYKNEARR